MRVLYKHSWLMNSSYYLRPNHMNPKSNQNGRMSNTFVLIIAIRGHLTKKCFSLKGVIQKLINDGTIEVNNLSNNEDHTVFKNPFMSHEKWESSTTNQNAPPQAKVDYAHHYDNNIGMIYGFDDTINVIIIKDKNWKKSSNAITQAIPSTYHQCLLTQFL